jgi:hypothetical protein
MSSTRLPSPIVERTKLMQKRTAKAALTLGLLLGFATLAGIVLLDGWQSSFMPRFLSPMLPLFALFVAWSWTRLKMGTQTMLGLASLSTIAVSAVWVYMAAAYYFTNVGATFGIHAAA